MRNSYETTIHIRCPFQPVWDYYKVRFESDDFLQVELIESCCEMVRGSMDTQENIGDTLWRGARQAFPNRRTLITVDGRHGANCRTIVNRDTSEKPEGRKG